MSEFHARDVSYARKISRVKKQASLLVPLVKTNRRWLPEMLIITKKVLHEVLENPNIR